MNRVDLTEIPSLAKYTLSCRASNRRVYPNKNNEKVIVLTEFIPVENISRHADYIAMLVSQHLENGKTVAIDCGIKGLMLGRFAVTRFNERVAADHLLNGLILDKVRKMTNHSVKAREEVRWVQAKFGIPRRHLFVIFEASGKNNN